MRRRRKSTSPAGRGGAATPNPVVARDRSNRVTRIRKQNTILKSLISETSTGPNNQPPFKYAVNSTIIQHAPTFSRTADGDAAEDQTASLAKVGRRGMHSAAGAYWNSEKDGMWSFKYDGGEKKGLDVVINVMWIAL